MSGARRAGARTRAIQAAPVGAVYVVPLHTNPAHVAQLARHLGRADLRVVGPRWLQRGALQVPEGIDDVILDPETTLKPQQGEELFRFAYKRFLTSWCEK